MTTRRLERLLIGKVVKIDREIVDWKRIGLCLVPEKYILPPCLCAEVKAKDNMRFF